MSTWLIIIIIILYGAFEFLNSIFFNWRLMLLSEKKFNTAGIFAAISTIMLVSSVIVAAYIGADSSSTGEILWWIVPFVALSMGVGNFFAALLVPKIRSWIESKKQKNEDPSE